MASAQVPSGPVVIGVDSSTQSTKVEARHVDTGAVLGVGRAPHPATEPPVSEQDPRAWWSALVTAMGQLTADVRAAVVALSVAGQQHGLVLLDADGAPLRPAKLWNDTTSADQADALVAEIGPQAWAQACGSVPVASFTVTKLAWVAEREPGLLARAALVCLPHDYLTWRLTGRAVTDRGDASGTGWYDVHTDRYRPDLLALAGAPHDLIERLPQVLGPFERAGALSDEAARQLGLPAGVAVGAGTGDNMAAALGLGLRSGDVALSLGTSGTVYSVADAPTADKRGLVAGFASAHGGFLPLVCTLNATRVTDTVAGWLGTDAAGLSELALAAPVDSAHPVLVPFFDGERTPSLPHATGSMSGLRTSTTREELALAAHDGVLCGLLAGLDALREVGVDCGGTLHLIGGGARSGAYRQRAADLHGAPIRVPDASEAVATGAAVQAAAVYRGVDPGALADAWQLGAGQVIEPNAAPGAAAAAATVRRAYADLVARLHP